MEKQTKAVASENEASDVGGPVNMCGIRRVGYLSGLIFLALLQHYLTNLRGHPEFVYFSILLLCGVLTAYRLQNIGWHWLWSIVLLIPAVNFVLVCYCLIYPEGYRRHRSMDVPSQLAAWLLFGVLVLCLIFILWQLLPLL